MTKKQKVSDPEAGMPARITLRAKTLEQKQAIKTIKDHDISILSGPPGTGKTFIAVTYGLDRFVSGEFKRLIFTRPCVEAYGESLGFLPGDFNEKIEPYMIPIFDIIANHIPRRTIKQLIEDGTFTTLPLAFQRGITFSDSYVLGDEFQNTAPQQVRMMLTRLGQGSKIVITGDPEQSDRPGVNGLVDAMDRLRRIDGIGIMKMSTESSVRHPLVSHIDLSYQNSD